MRPPIFSLPFVCPILLELRCYERVRNSVARRAKRPGTGRIDVAGRVRGW